MSNAATIETTGSQTGPRLLIGGLMLAVMAAWVHVNHDPAPTGLVTLLAAAAAVAFGAGIMELRAHRAHAVGGSGLLAFSLALVAAIGANWLAFQFGKEALGETLGLAMFAALALAAAIEERSAGMTSEGTWQKVVDRRGGIGLVLALLGGGALGSFFYFGFVKQIGAEYFPEHFGMMLSGFLLFFGGLYLLLSKDPPPSVDAMRTFVVLLGSLLGGTLTIVSLIRAYTWREEILRFGQAARSGGETWQFWLVAYLFLAGIALIFASLNLTGGQVRSDATFRRATQGYGSIVTAVLLLIMLAFVNVFIAWKAPYTFNWSKTRGLTALNASSKKLLNDLKEPTTAFVLMSPGARSFNEVSNFLGNCQADTDKLTVTYIDPDTDFAKYQKLATRFKEIVAGVRNPFDEDGGRGVLLVYGAIPDDVNKSVPHVFIPERKLFEFDQRAGPGKEKLVLKAESEIIRELAFLAKKSERRKIYVLQDDGALDMNVNDVSARQSLNAEIASLGAGKLVDKLKKDNFDVRGLSFGVAPQKDAPKDIDYLGSITGDKKIEMPLDCELLIVPGPTSPLPQAGLDALERYVDQQSGKLIVALDAVADQRYASLRRSGMETFLKKYGVEVTNQVLYRRPVQRDQMIFGRSVGDFRAVLALTPPRATTVLAKQFDNVPFRWWSARVVKPGTSAKYQVEPLLVVNTKQSIVWADENLSGYADFERYLNDLIDSGRIKTLYNGEPIPVAVTVTERVGDATKPRMVVFGDAEFLDNEDLQVYPTNFDLIASSIEWMSERSFVGPRPKESPRYEFGPNADLNSMVFGTFWTMMIVILVLGVGTWLVRRK